MRSRLPRGVIALAFCPTGEGGGRDNSCSPANAGTGQGDLFSRELKRELGMPTEAAVQRAAERVAANTDGIRALEQAYRAARDAYNRLRRQLRDDPTNADLRRQFNDAAREDRNLRQQLANARDAVSVAQHTVTPPATQRVNVSNENSEEDRLRQQYREARQAYNRLRPMVRANPDDQELRAQFNAAVREDNLARRQLREFEARQQTPISPRLPETATPAARQARDETIVIEQAAARVEETRRAVSRVQQRLLDQAESIPFIESAPGGQRLNTWRLLESGQHRAEYQFKTPSNRLFSIKVYANQSSSYDSNWILLFNDDQGSYSRTGRGEAFHVFSNVVPATLKFIQHIRPKSLTFSAEGRSRVDLYAKLAKIVIKMYPDQYELDISGEGSDHAAFYIKRK